MKLVPLHFHAGCFPSLWRNDRKTRQSHLISSFFSARRFNNTNQYCLVCKLINSNAHSTVFLGERSVYLLADGSWGESGQYFQYKQLSFFLLRTRVHRIFEVRMHVVSFKMVEHHLMCTPRWKWKCEPKKTLRRC